MLKSIEISGFKSFGKKSYLEFTRPISAIVGPNGSGKSNVAEAFRFVLGEQSIKSLRGKRAEDLIFNGGKDNARANRASVKVTFDNQKRLLNVDFDEVSLERVVHRDSVSEYFINGSLVRLKDIIELLAQAHIGASGHHIISQGEADKILNANIRDRREMIEDALGLKIFQYKKVESERKLEKTEENIASVESLRRELSPHLKFLKKQMEKIEKTIELRRDLTQKYLEYFKRESEYLKAEKATLTEAKVAPEHERDRLNEQLLLAKKTLNESKDKDQKSTDIIRLEGELKTTRMTKDDILRQIGRLEGEMTSLQKFLQKQKEVVKNTVEQPIDFSEVERLATQVIVSADQALVATDLDGVKSHLNRIKDLFSDFLSGKRTVSTAQDFSELEAEIKKSEALRVDLEQKVTAYLQKEKSLQAQIDLLREEIEKEKDSNRDAEKAVFRIMAEQNEINNQLNQLRGREERLARDEAQYKNELTEAGVLVGNMALHFQNLEIKDTSGQIIPLTVIVAETRELQEERKHQIEKLKIRLEDAGIGSSDEIVKEFTETTERDAFLARELEDLLKSLESLKVLIKDLELRIDTEFKSGVEKINSEFQHYFALMFGGGSARLAVVREKKRKQRSDTDLSALGTGEMPDLAEEVEEEKEGLEIEVNLPRKKIKGLEMLSGGERALTSIALLFAVSQVNPPPFIILDETDAPLDEANSRKYGDMIENLSKCSQLILITHNRETMSRAGLIYGVTMGGDGVSKILSIQFEEAVVVAK